MRYQFVSFLAFVAVNGCVFVVEDGNGDLVTETREPPAFEALRAEVSVPVTVTVGGEPSVTLTCDENLLDRFDVDVVDGELVIQSDALRPMNPSEGCRFDVVVADLTGVTAVGSGPVAVEGATVALESAWVAGSGGLTVDAPIDVASFAAGNLGSGDVTLAAVVADEVSLEGSGSGDLVVESGVTSSLDARLTGSGNLDAQGLVAAHATVWISGSGDALVTATDDVDATTLGSGDVRVWGAPEGRESSSIGSGEVVFEE
jgi:hypothetical protein